MNVHVGGHKTQLCKQLINWIAALGATTLRNMFSSKMQYLNTESSNKSGVEGQL